MFKQIYERTSKMAYQIFKSRNSRNKRWFPIIRLLKDKRQGVDFYTTEKTAEAGHSDYVPTSTLYDRHLKKFLRRRDHSRDSVIDVGCGKGRMLEVFHSYGFSRVDGLEYSPEMSETARENMKKLGLSSEIFTGDAAEFDGYDDYNWFYLFNPFGMDIMREFLGKLEESLRHRPRAVTILYANPRCESVFADAGFHIEDLTRGKGLISLITNEGVPSGMPLG